MDPLGCITLIIVCGQPLTIACGQPLFLPWLQRIRKQGRGLAVESGSRLASGGSIYSGSLQCGSLSVSLLRSLDSVAPFDEFVQQLAPGIKICLSLRSSREEPFSKSSNTAYQVASHNSTLLSQVPDDAPARTTKAGALCGGLAQL